MELYRYLVEDFLIQNSASFKKKDFMMKHEDFSKNKAGQREYLNNSATSDLTRKLYDYFESTVEIERIRHGKRQTVETLINEEALLLAQYLRNENQTWNPRTPFWDWPPFFKLILSFVVLAFQKEGARSNLL
jgi:hypothetical protein